jgi:3-deoxy-manno-octulosonate cytidylyltransferase (CMP-KDO synthetase)
VVTDLNGWALYFSRSLIPYPRNQSVDTVKKHLGIYAYRADVLRQFKTWPVSALETAESLEQLRFIEHGIRIKMAQGLPVETAVDTPEQAEQVRAILLQRAAIATTT